MKKVIRRGVFETNSSSCHSISVQGEDSYSNFLGWNEIVVESGEFGWGPENLFGVHDKLSYVITSIQYYVGGLDTYEELISTEQFVWLSEMVRDYCGAELVVRVNSDDYYPLGYVDHDSVDILSDSVYEYIDRETNGEKIRGGFWSYDENTFKENMRELIFNDKYYIIIDNDNY